MKIEAVVFDAYGTLFDVHSVVQSAGEGISGDLGALSQLWRRKQIEFTWRRALMGQYRDFWDVTEEALQASATVLGVRPTPSQLSALMDAYLSPALFPEVPAALESLKGYTLAILSNGSPRMLEAAVRASGLDSQFAHIISVDQIKTYKPSRAVYGLGSETLKMPAQRILFVSSNAWDAAGAKAFGYHACWCNRSREKPDDLGFPPDFTVERLDQIEDYVARLR